PAQRACLGEKAMNGQSRAAGWRLRRPRFCESPITNHSPSRKQHPLAPAAIAELVAVTLVQAELGAEPELDPIRHDAEAGPMRWPRYRLVGEALLHLVDPALELAAAFERLRLQRGPGADLTHPWPRGEVLVGLFVADTLDPAFDPHLYLIAQRLPVE